MERVSCVLHGRAHRHAPWQIISSSTHGLKVCVLVCSNRLCAAFLQRENLVLVTAGVVTMDVDAYCVLTADIVTSTQDFPIWVAAPTVDPCVCHRSRLIRIATDLILARILWAENV